MERKQIIADKGDKEGTIKSLVNFLAEAMAKGATHYRMEWSGDPNWAFKWFCTYRILTDEEVLQEEIKKKEYELNQLRKREKS